MSIREKLIEVALAEWEWFGRDLTRKDRYIGPGGATTFDPGPKTKPNPRKETVEPFASRIGDYWLAIPTASYNQLVKDNAKPKGKLDGTVDLAWSAAFISYCMQMAGAGTSFPYASGHAAWITKAIKNKQDDKLNAALVGYKPGKIALQPGDLIGRPRESGITYKNAVAKGWFKSHTDIVIEVDAANRKAFVIGGNVGQSCSKAEVEVDKNGMLVEADGWMVHIQNNIALPKGGAAAVALSSKSKAG